ncbi:MAG: glucosamine-6-phosphate deaminase [Bacilli bacterium]|nr:glucosamine-6-phosphate deaminase [Bacilli bacterium]
MRFIIKKNSEEIGEAIAEEIATLIKNKPNCVLGLATGSSPIPTYKQLIKKYENKEISFKEVTSFNLDEYINYPYEYVSYKYFMDDELFNHVDMRNEAKHFPSQENLEEYDSEIEKAGGVDIQVLGIGVDGHIGFNEPGCPFDSKTHVMKLDESTRLANQRFFKCLEDVPTHAVTMGIGTILKSKKNVLIASDLSKIDAVASLLKGVPTIEWPATALINHPDTDIYLTEDLYEAAKKKAGK